MTTLCDNVVALPGLLTPTEQLDVVTALGALPCPKADELASVRIELGLDRAGAPLPPSLAALAAIGRRAFRRAAAAAAPAAAPDALSSLGRDDAELTATALVYGARASMREHVDASVRRRPKWLVVLSLGCECGFRAGGRAVRLRSGDALAMDAAAVMHGVDEIAPGTAPAELAARLDRARVSVMLWRAAPARSAEPAEPDSADLGALFGSDDDDAAAEDAAAARAAVDPPPPERRSPTRTAAFS